MSGPPELPGSAFETEDLKFGAHRLLVARILDGDGTAPAAQRRAAFENRGLTGALEMLIDKVARKPAQITDDDFAAARSSLASEDQLFELVICAAVGESTRLYEAGLRALDDAVAESKVDRHAS